MSSVSHCALQHTYTHAHRANSIPQTLATPLMSLPWQTTHHSGLKWCYVLNDDMLYNGNMVSPQCPVLLTRPMPLFNSVRGILWGYFDKQKHQMEMLQRPRLISITPTVYLCPVLWWCDPILLLKWIWRGNWRIVSRTEESFSPAKTNRTQQAFCLLTLNPGSGRVPTVRVSALLRHAWVIRPSLFVCTCAHRKCNHNGVKTKKATPTVQVASLDLHFLCSNIY